jgi:hypothetical protein
MKEISRANRQEVAQYHLHITSAVNQGLDPRVHGLSASLIEPVLGPGDVRFPTLKPLLSFGPEMIGPRTMPADVDACQDIMNP